MSKRDVVGPRDVFQTSSFQAVMVARVDDETHNKEGDGRHQA
jgi:hypothetical protein